MKKKIIIIGGGGHTRVLIDILSFSKEMNFVGFTDLEPKKGVGIKYLGDDRIIEKYSKNDVFLVNGIGSVGVPARRENVYEKFKKLGYKFHAVIHPETVISSKIDLGEGVQVMAGAVVNTGTIVGNNTIINSSSTIDHDCKIGDHCHISPGVILSGSVTIGNCSHIGTGAVVIQRIKIAEHVLVGAGSVVVEDIASNQTVFGVPAKVHKKR